MPSYGTQRQPMVTRVEHGTRTRYTYGCRCDRCVAANAEYKSRQHRRAHAETPRLSESRRARVECGRAAHEAILAAAAERDAVFAALDIGSDTRICACPKGHSIRAHDFTTNGHGGTIAVCPTCGWSAPAAATRGVA